MLDHIFEFIGLLEPDGTLCDVNRPALRFAGVQKREVVGKPFWETPWWAGDARRQEKLEEAVRRAAHGELVRFETHHESAEGEEICVDFSLQPILDEAGAVVSLVAEGRDITEHKRIEQLREQWTVAVAHELRQPQNALSLWLGVLERRMGELGERERRSVVHMRSALRQLERMTRDLLDAARIEANQLELRPEKVMLDELVRQVVEDLTVGSICDVRVEVEPGRHLVRGDTLRLQQVVGNLLENAFKYHRPETTIRVVVRSTEGSVELRIENESDALSETDLARLFERFYRSGAVRRSPVSGTGLGLHITRCLVEAHAGTVSASSRQPDTVSFTVCLPRYEPVAKPAVAPAPSPRARSSMR